MNSSGAVVIQKQCERHFNEPDDRIDCISNWLFETNVKNIKCPDTDNLENHILYALNTCPYVGIMILDANLNATYCNETAKNICHAIKSDGIRCPSLYDTVIPIPFEIINECTSLKSDLYTDPNSADSLRESYVKIGSRSRYEFKVIKNTTTTLYGQSLCFVIMIEDSLAAAQLRERKIISRYKFTTREIQICSLIKEGLTNKEISNTLFVNLCTIETHIRNIFKKSDVSNRTELIKQLNSV